ncbi:MAG: ABC transporter ATP-binding protein [Planctomycetes bacterium]|nr:ABC transporter ATP-binding protein [Planctomycetota bacterium]
MSGRLVVEDPQSVAIAVRGVSKVHGHGPAAVLALDRIDFEVQRGEFVCIVGASGCGKSSLLHLIAGLDQPTSGQIGVTGGATSLMFQDPALFPWLSVEENVAFPLELRGVAKAERKSKVAELLALVHLEAFARRQPHELSGGMRQRVALARALANASHVLLMDEPFAALDAMMRDKLHEDLERIVAATGLTVLFVTHNVREAVRLGDRVLLFSSRPGRLAAQWDVAIPHPRRIESREVSELAALVTDRLRSSSASSPHAPAPEAAVS